MLMVEFKLLGADVDSASDGCFAVEMVRTKLKKPAASLSGEGLSTDALLEEEENRDRDRLYDIIVMDNLMPLMNGQDACAQMRSLGFNGLILGLTGNALPEDVAAYLARGANTVLITKPLVVKATCGH